MFYPWAYKITNTKDRPVGTVLVEVFKTNIRDRQQADMLINAIHKNFTEYKANVDLWDCDKILRIQSATGFIQTSTLIHFLTGLGCSAEVLE